MVSSCQTGEGMPSCPTFFAYFTEGDGVLSSDFKREACRELAQQMVEASDVCPLPIATEQGTRTVVVSQGEVYA
jgi:hypothetical protein